MTRILSAVVLSMLVAYPAFATSFWLSPSGTESGSTQPADPNEIPTLYNFATQNPGSVYIWARPDPNQTLRNWSLRVESSDPNTLTFTTSTVYNPVLFEDPNGFHVRWEFTHEPTGQVTDSNCNVVCSKDFMGFTITSDPNNLGLGIGPNTTTVDPNYFSSSDSWLLAKLDYMIDASSPGSTDLFLQIGALGLNNVGQTSIDTTVFFGDMADLTALNGLNNRESSSSDPDAHVLISDADFDDDTFVTGADFLIWQRGLGIGSTHADGDADFDNDVDAADLAAWEFQYGFTIPNGGLMVDGMAVPEPATWALACLAFSGLLTRGRRKLPLGDP